MKSTARICFVCGGATTGGSATRYARCISCGHEMLFGDAAQGNFVNDRLERSRIGRANSLDRFKNAVLRRCARSCKFLLDIGAASGRFLFQNRGKFERAMGIEVTPECIEFAREHGLDIETDLASLRGSVTVVTFWHTLEHLPPGVIESMLAVIREHSTEETVLIVSVPNADSLQYSLLNKCFAFYDVPKHRHQFTPRSLDLLLARFGFNRGTEYGSLPYAVFGWLQGMLNLFNSRHDYLYYRRKRGLNFGLSPMRLFMLDACNIVLAVIFLAPCMVLVLYDLLLPRRGGVLTVCYRAKIHSI